MTGPEPCRWCGTYHQQRCPLVRSLEYHEDGVTVKRVEFWPLVDRFVAAPGSRYEEDWG